MLTILDDEVFSKFKCDKLCERGCERGEHDCPALCYQTCPPCNHRIQHDLKCGHTLEDLCHKVYCLSLLMLFLDDRKQTSELSVA